MIIEISLILLIGYSIYILIKLNNKNNIINTLRIKELKDYNNKVEYLSNELEKSNSKFKIYNEMEDIRLKEKEKMIRKDSINKSKQVIVGKVYEQLIPFFPCFNYNPKDARFLGSPVDFIVFNGLDNGELKDITFVEVKSGESNQLTKREKLIQECVNSGRIEFVILNPTK